MEISITGLHIHTDPKLKAYAHKKAKKMLKYHPRILDINVRLISEKAHRGQEKDFYCEIIVKIPGKVLEIVDSERAFDKAIDKAVDRMKKKLTRLSEKEISKKHKEGIAKKLLRRLKGS